MQLKVFKKFCDNVTPNTHKRCLACVLLLLDSGGREHSMLQGQHQQSFLLQRTRLWMVLCLYYECRTQWAARWLHSLPTQRSCCCSRIRRKKRSANRNLSWVGEERDLIRRNKWWLLCVPPTSGLLPSQGEMQPGKWVMLNLLHVYLRLRASWIQPVSFLPILT